MALRTWLPLVLVVAFGCGKGDDKPADPPAPGSAVVEDDKRCLQLAKLCGDKAKHVEKIIDECKQVTKKAAAKCPDKVTAAHDCYQRDVCGTSEKVWSLTDLGVLAERHGKCATERTALRSCIGE
jgi:hypothetical protein